MNTKALAIEAVRAAARIRADHGIGPAGGLCPYDLAIKLGIKVSFLSAGSLEGMYSPAPKPAIILSSERPAGRRRFTCGHEIGHHVFKHGYRIDELDESNSAPWTPEEFIATRFSSALLMPKLAIDSAFSKRGWSLSTATADQVFIVAQELGVGYSTLVRNVEMNLNGISKARAEDLRRVTLANLRKSLAGQPILHDVFYVDKHWARATIDVEVGDVLILPVGAEVDAQVAVHGSSNKRLFTASAPGVVKINLGSGLPSPTLRVSRRGFDGLARYRHLEEPSDAD